MYRKLYIFLFDFVWEQRKLGDISQIMSGGTPSTSTPEFWNGDIDWYSPVEIGEQIFVNGSQKKITELGLQKSSAKILPVGTILFTSRAGIGNTAILAKEGCTNQGFQSIVPRDELDSYFIFSRTNELKRYGEINGAGSTFTEISGKQMAKMLILIPKMAEQKKIGAFFKCLDDTIALHQRKLDLLKKQKAFFLKNMFPGNNSNRPNLRFNKFADKWEFQELGKVALITMGQSPDSKNYTSNPSDNILVQGNADMKNGHVSPRVWTTQITKRAEKGDLILSVRAPVGDVGKTEFDVVLGRGVAAIKGNEFLFQLLNKINEDKYWAKYSTGSTFESINSTEIIKAKINIPNESEQITIGNFLEQVDKLITFNRKKLVQSKKIKEVFLQNIFV